MKEKKLRIAMLGHKHMLSREGGIEIVVKELATRMVAIGSHSPFRYGMHALLGSMNRNPFIHHLLYHNPF